MADVSFAGPGNPQMTPQPNYYANQGMQHGPIRSPMALFNPHPEHQHCGFPNQPGNPSGHYIPGNSSGGPPMPRPGYWPFPNQGRDGTSFSNPGRRRSRGRGGRGVGHRGDATSVNLYRKFMVEDPWKDLNPAVWRAAVTSSDAKKPRVEEVCTVPKPKESLADYLAAEGGDAL